MPETATRVLVLYRVGNGFAQPGAGGRVEPAGLDGRFDVQVRQSLPFMDFSNAKWEMLLAVRNFFRETGPISRSTTSCSSSVRPSASSAASRCGSEAIPVPLPGDGA